MCDFCDFISTPPCCPLLGMSPIMCTKTPSKTLSVMAFKSNLHTNFCTRICMPLEINCPLSGNPWNFPAQRHWLSLQDIAERSHIPKHDFQFMIQKAINYSTTSRISDSINLSHSVILSIHKENLEYFRELNWVDFCQ